MPFLNKILRKFAKQKAVYLQKQDVRPDGTAYYTDPVEISVRWEDKQQEAVSDDGRTVTATAYVLTGTAVEEGSLLWRGTMAEYKALHTYPRPPSARQGAREILIVRQTPDLNAQQYLYEVYL